MFSNISINNVHRLKLTSSTNPYYSKCSKCANRSTTSASACIIIQLL